VSATAGTSSITVRWAAPTENAGVVTRYTAVADPGPASCTTATAHETTCTLGAVAGTSYTVTVVAHTAAGINSAPSDPTAPVIATPPAVPVIVPDTDANLTTDRGPISAAAPGQQIVLIGTGFAPHSTVTIAIYSAPMLLATVITDNRGDFTHSVTVPPDLPVGEHTFVAMGVDADGEPYAMKLRVAVAPGPAGPGTGTDPLAATGAGTAPLVSTGLLLIVVGAVAYRTGATSGQQPARRGSTFPSTAPRNRPPAERDVRGRCGTPPTAQPAMRPRRRRCGATGFGSLCKLFGPDHR
jgi:titin